MATHAALLRGINVGKAKRVDMAELRALVEALGYRDARTLLNSGNVVFTAPGVVPADAAARIEGALAERTGISARVIVIGAEALAEAVAANPLAAVATDPARYFVGFVGAPADLRRLAPLAAQEWSPGVLAVGKHAVYLWCPDGFSNSKLVETITRALQGGVTMRNWTTTIKLQALAAGGSGTTLPARPV